MKTLYLDCSMGCAGDMLTAALFELIENKEEFIEELGALGLENVSFEIQKAVKCGITGTHFSVKVGDTEESEDMHAHHHEHEHTHDHEHEHKHEHSHNSMHGIEHIVNSLNIPAEVKVDILAVYGIIASAESKVHGVPMKDIHFHEVGTMDAVFDVTAVCLLMDKLGAKKVASSPVHVGSGHVHCAHGILPVPAPATAEILKGIPSYGGAIQSELCTPTGAALLKYFVKEFGSMPVMTIDKIGYGMGKKDFERANCVRAILGGSESKTDSVFVLSANIDDMTAEELAFAKEKLLDGGALDVFTAPISMKKSRTGTILEVLCKEDRKADLVKLIFKHTSTLGIREREEKRYVLDREETEVETVFGKVRAKKSYGYGTEKEKFEFDDLSKIADENGLSIKEVSEKISGK